MPSMNKTILQTVIVTLFSVMTFVQPCAMAADSQHSSVVHCKPGTSNCLPTTGSFDAAAWRDRLGECPRDSQDCDPRSKANRIRADRESRDRHACRD